MNTEAIVYRAMENITGITKADFEEYKDVHLVESGILDSLSLISLLSEISSLAGKKILIENIRKEDLGSIDAFIRAVGTVL